ncbi:unnamed protein product [Diatraea saccharalis]|uniref:Uncharacterized protein n=1 Tax=Diatraea saccharalis TaxID=40085 RepID=A0A9N9RFA3_9NEOP|nr:unnamed protein product [Diatraea saccharalis]
MEIEVEFQEDLDNSNESLNQIKGKHSQPIELLKVNTSPSMLINHESSLQTTPLLSKEDCEHYIINCGVEVTALAKSRNSIENQPIYMLSQEYISNGTFDCANEVVPNPIIIHATADQECTQEFSAHLPLDQDSFSILDPKFQECIVLYNPGDGQVVFPLNLPVINTESETFFEGSIIVQNVSTIPIQNNNSIILTSTGNEIHKVARAYDNKHLDMRISSIISCDESLLEVWRSFIKNERRPFDYTDLEEQLTSIGSYEYQHKCIEHRKTAKSVADDQTQNACSSNFDLADVDSLFDNESDGEPASKKVKFDSNKVDVILNRLEQDTILLCGIKENIFTDEHKRRIRLLNDKLTHVIT